MTWKDFEKQSKKILDQREISPSKEAWERLSGQLEQREIPARKYGVWYAVAAGFAGLLIALTLFLNAETSGEGPDLEGTPEGTELVSDENEENLKPTENVLSPEKMSMPEIEENNHGLVASEQEEVPMIMEMPEDIPSEAVAVVDEDTRSELETQDRTKEEKLIDTKIAEVLAMVNLREQNAGKLTDAEVDSLLRNAEKELLQEKVFQQGNTVDAMALLNEVEDELNQTFRDQIFEKLRDGFDKVRTAVADRNN